MAYKKHMMYSDDESEMAQTNEKPSGFKLREVNSPMLCWKTHERVPGTTEGAKKSCQHKNPAKRPK